MKYPPFFKILMSIILLDKPTEIIDRYKKQYQPAPNKPDWFVKALTNIGGLNVFGEPNLRVVWGMDERTFRGGNPDAIKYLGTTGRELGMPAWILEEWWSPDRLGTPEDWERERYFVNEAGKRTDAIGEYPSRGKYWLFEMLIGVDGRPSALTESTLDYIRMLWTNRLEPQNATDNAKRYREMLDKQAELEKKQELEMKAQDEMAWGEVLKNWDKGLAAQTRGYSITPR